MSEKSTSRVLIVDDDPAIQKVLNIGLELSGYKTRGATSGGEALEILRSGGFSADCVLLDIRMPGISGLELLGILKKEQPMIPVIMLTANNDLETAIGTMKQGAFDYMVKPVRKFQLVETIRKALRYRELQLENARLARENTEYQRFLERKVAARTEELFQAYEKLKRTNLDTVRILAETIEAKDPYTRGHCNRVRILSQNIAHHLEWNAGQVEILEYGALLHDIGKLGISELLLHKDEGLSRDERRSIELHPVIGENILKTVEFFDPCLSIVRHHHEWFNGAGYPDRLQYEQIHLAARIVAISDAFDAMTSTRPYREAMSVDRALVELRRGRGEQFDPRLLDIFIEKEVFGIIPVGSTIIEKIS